MKKFSIRGKSKEKRSNSKLKDFIQGIDLNNTTEYIDEMRAMQLNSVYACIRILSETVASLPLFLFRKEKDKRIKAREHPLYEVLNILPNNEMTSFSLREVLMTSLLLYGNSYARIIRDNSGHVKELWPLDSRNVQVKRDDTTKEIKYVYTDKSLKTYTYSQSQIFHVVGLSYNGLIGLSPIEQAMKSINLAIATEDFGVNFFRNGARPGGVLEHPGIVKNPEALRDSWNKVYQGVKNSHKVAVLEEGMKYHEIGIPPEQAQFLETRKYQLNEICRIFRVPPHMVGDLERSTFSNIEHQSIEFVEHTIRPYLVRFEQAIYKCLLNENERRLYYAKFNVDGLLRGDFNTRMQGYATGRQNGWLSVNDIRELEDMNPISKEDGGNSYLVNGNMVSANYANKKENKSD